MVYEPEEDSVMLAKEVERFAKGNMLDMGTGTGIIAKIAAKKESVKSVIAVDIDKQAIDFCKNKYKNETILKKIKFIQSDLFKNIKGKFDFIVFNPPYLPYDPDEPEDLAIATTGGKYGFELTHKFLDQALEHLEITGSILLLFSTLTKKRKVEEKITELLLEFEKISELKISFETLYVYRIRRSNLLIELKKLNIKNIKPLTHGHRGVIYTGNWKDKKITIKAQRTDIDAQGTVNIEAQQLEKLNKYKIGPRILEKKDDFFIYEYVNGEFILDYFEELKNKTKEEKEKNKKIVIKILKNVLDQMYTLDKLGLNKEEMHRPLKHILITNPSKITLLDFERCKTKQKTHNVTQFCQFLLSGFVKPYMKFFDIKINKEELMQISKDYYEKRTDASFNKILEFLK